MKSLEKNDTIANFKRLTVSKLDHVLRVQNQLLEGQKISKQFSILVFTTFGHIEGEYHEDSEEGDLGVKFLSTAVESTKHPNPPVIYLKDAKITPYGHNEPAHIIETLAIFSDQIVGISFK